MSDLISVIVPVYKVEKYLRECLDSLINQTYTNLEIILVNDESPDNSILIMEEYKEKDSRIKTYTVPHGGLSAARNFGISVSSGKYIGFLDSDDKAMLSMFETLHDLLVKNETDISMCDFQRSTESLHEEDISVKLYDMNDIYDEIMLDKISAHAWSKLYKKELFDFVQFPLGLHFEDLAVFYKLAFNCKKIVITNEQLVWYRINNPTSITQNSANSLFNAVCIAQISREKTEFCTKHNLSVIDGVLKMSAKYNTDTYRNIKKDKEYTSELPLIKEYLSKYYKDIMKNSDIDIIKKLFTFLIVNGLY